MKILFTAGSFERGGKEQRLVSLIESLGANDVEMALIAGSESPHLASVRGRCRKIYSYKAGQRVFNMREHLRAIREFQPDVIHSWNRGCTTYAILASWLRKCPVVTSEITNARSLRIWSGEYWVTRFNFRLARAVLSNSRAGLKAKRAPGSKGKVIYNGYRLSRLGEVAKEKYAHLSRSTGLNVIMGARFCRQKDFDTVLRAACGAQDAHLAVTFTLAGDGQELARLQGVATEMGLRNILFVGHIRDMDNLLHHMDVGLLATDPRFHQEGIPNFVMECMAHALPVVVTDGPAISEIVQDGFNGYITAPRDADALLRKLVLLSADPGLLCQLGENASRTVNQRFNLTEMRDGFMKTYQAVADSQERGCEVETVIPR